MIEDKRVNFLINFITLLVAAGVFYLIFKYMIIYTLPFIIAGILSSAVQPISLKIEKNFKIKSSIVASVLVIFLYAVIALLIFAIGYRVYAYLWQASKNIPDYLVPLGEYFNKASQRLDSILNHLPSELSQMVSDFPRKLISGITNWFVSSVTDFGKVVVTGAPGVLMSVFISIILSIFLAADFSKIKAFLKELLPQNSLESVSIFKNQFGRRIKSIAKGYLIIFIITISELFVGMIILGNTPGTAIALAFLIALVDIMPIFGTGTVLVPWALTRLFYSDPVGCIKLIILYIVITIVRNIIEPKIVGKQMGLHPVLTLLSMFIGLKIFGVLGVFVMPLALTLIFDILMARFAHQKA